MSIPKLVRHLTGVVVLLLAVGQLTAQGTKFMVQDITAPAGEDFFVRVSATEFADVVGVQLSLAWDTTKIEFVGVDSIVLDGTFNDNFNRTQLDSGRLGYLLVDPSVSGFGLMGEVHLFSLRFRPVMNVTMTTEIAFADAPLRFSAMDNRNNRLECTKESGTVLLEGTSGIPALAEDPRFRVSPNPFVEELLIKARLNYAAPAARLEVRDLSGRLLLDRQEKVGAGNWSTVLGADMFPAAGAYFIRLVTDREQLSRKVILTTRN